MARAGPAQPTGPPDRRGVVIAAGDIATCEGGGDEATATLLGEMLEAEPDATVLTLGDHAYPDGAPEEFRDCFDPTWGRFRARIHPSPGNHDFHTAGARGYFDYFGDAAGEDGEGWYSFDVGDWHLVSLNSVCGSVGCGPDSEQVAWLAADLVEHADADCTLAYWHHPRFSSGTAHGSNQATDSLWRTLDDAGADLVLAGHEHHYERFVALDPTGVPDAAGMVSFVVGTGGRSLYPGFTQPPIDGSAHRAADTLGLLELTLGPGSYDWRFVAVDGTVVDAGSGLCH